MPRVHCAVLNHPHPHPPHTGGGGTGSQRYGGHGERETPGPIPNPEAKPLSADGTAPGTGWESRTPPDNHSRTGPSHHAGARSCIPDAVVEGDRVRRVSLVVRARRVVLPDGIR